MITIVGIAVLVGAIVVAVTDHGRAAKPFAHPAFQPQVARNFESIGNPKGALSTTAVHDIAKNNSYEFLPKFADSFNIQQHFQDVDRIVAAAHSYGNDIKVFDYFNASYWYTSNDVGWKPYTDDFQQSWLLKDASGRPIPYYGNSVGGDSKVQIGWMIDLSNPQYRQWALKTILGWMKAAPYGGIDFDSSNQMSGAVVSRYVASGTSSFNTLLCGSAAATDLVDGNCSRVQAWDAGLASLLSSTTHVLNEMHLLVRYNGIAPTANRGPTRNVGLLADTNMVDNEGFCLGVAENEPNNVTFNPLTADLTLMQQFAREGKIVTETTSTYTNSPRQQYGDYCVAGFLLGWQPGSSFLCVHPSYSVQPTAKQDYPVVPEQNLNLGNPLTTGYQTKGAALTRSFQNGFVAVNPSGSPITVVVPEAVVAFAHGSAGTHYAAGTTVTLPAHGALLSLTQQYLYGTTAA